MRTPRLPSVVLSSLPVFLLFALAAASGSAVAQSKGKPATNPKASVTILSGHDIQGDLLDRYGDPVPYVDGQDGVEANIWTGGSNDVTLRLWDSTRKFSVRHTALGGCTNGQPCPNGQIENGTETSGWFINIRQIGAMESQKTKWTHAHFMVWPSRQTQSQFSWCGNLDSTAAQYFGVTPPPTSTNCVGSEFLVSATCTAADDQGCYSWTVSTSDSRDTLGTYVSPVSGLTTYARKTLWYGLYQTSFQLQIVRLRTTP